MKAGTVDATNYLNLPAPNLTPITLDTTSVPNRVGINKTVPAYNLDVNGSFRTGRIIVLGGSGETLIWSDSTNNFVGIGTTTPTSLLDVDGNANIKTLNLTSLPAKTTETNVLYYDTTTKAVSYGTSPTPQVGSIWTYVLSSDLSTPQNTPVQLTTITMPYVGLYSIQVGLKTIAGANQTGTFTCYISTTSLNTTYSWPNTVGRNIGSITNTQMSDTGFIYRAATAGTRYVTVTCLALNITLKASECILIVTYNGP
jgi:hypothetical protein